MKLFVALAVLMMCCLPALAQESFADRLARIEREHASMMSQLAAISAKLDKLSPVNTSTQGVAMGPSFQTQPQVCGPQGCTPQAQGAPMSSQGEYSSGGLFSRLRERRASRRGY